MAKETVRYPDALVARIEAFVTDSSAFESKSEYHRFASEFLLSLLDPDHEASVLGYAEIYGDLGAELDGALDDSRADEREHFLETYIRVRRHLLHGEPEEARAVVDDTYDVTDREALLLDELIGESRRGKSAPHTDAGRYASADGERTANGRVGRPEATTESEAGEGEREQDPQAVESDD